MGYIKRILCLVAFLVFFVEQMAAQSIIKVQGTVVSSDGEPLPGASIRIPDANKMTVTDIDGKFSMSDVKTGAKITISFIGMQPKTVTAKASLKVVLEDKQTAMDELLVTAFGEQKRSAFTGSAAVVDSKKIEQKQAQPIFRVE